MRKIGLLVRQLAKDPLQFRIIRYGIVGGGSSIVSLGFFFLFNRILGIWYVYASPLSDWLAYGIAFTFHKLWTFESKELYKASWQLPAHLLLKLGWNAAILTPFVLYYVVENWGWEPWASKLAAGVAIGFFQNYFVCKHVIFNPVFIAWIVKQKRKIWPVL
jgi:putative flippase GtrA